MGWIVQCIAIESLPPAAEDTFAASSEGLRLPDCYPMYYYLAVPSYTRMNNDVPERNYSSRAHCQARVYTILRSLELDVDQTSHQVISYNTTRIHSTTYRVATPMRPRTRSGYSESQAYCDPNHRRIWSASQSKCFLLTDIRRPHSSPSRLPLHGRCQFITGNGSLDRPKSSNIGANSQHPSLCGAVRARTS